MKNINYKKRLIDGKLKTYLETFGAVCIEGPKWCGKTWTCKQAAESEFKVADPIGNFQNRHLAEIDPSAILEGKTPRLIDEWQEVPAIWDAVRFDVDQSETVGKYLLSGSSTPKRKGIHHSGAGRIARLRMNTMSLYESGKSSGIVSLATLVDNPPKATLTGEVQLANLADYIVTGGWPVQFKIKSTINGSLLAKEYLEATITDDMNRLEDKKRDIEKMKRLVRSLARNESTTASIKLLKKDMENADGRGLDEDTIADYLDVLNRMFMLSDQMPFSTNVRSSTKIKQSPKRHFTDPSIPCSLLGLTKKSLIGDLNTFGFLFEALCERDMRIYAESIDAKLYHYQDYSNKEIDAVVQYQDGRWGAFEIKLGANQIDAAAENLLKIKKEFEEDNKAIPPTFLCVICGMSNSVYTRPDGVIVIPITALKN